MVTNQLLGGMILPVLPIRVSLEDWSTIVPNFIWIQISPRHSTPTSFPSFPFLPASLPSFLPSSLYFLFQTFIWQCVKTLVPLVNIKIAGKWMFIPLKKVLIGIDP